MLENILVKNIFISLFWSLNLKQCGLWLSKVLSFFLLSLIIFISSSHAERTHENGLLVTDMLDQYMGEELGKSFNHNFHVHYLTTEQLAAFKITIENGLLYEANGKLLDSAGKSGIFVVDPYGNFYFSKFSFPTVFHHSSFLAGNAVAGAGEMVISHGRVISLNNESGHYKPSNNLHEQVKDLLYRQSVEISEVYYVDTSMNFTRSMFMATYFSKNFQQAIRHHVFKRIADYYNLNRVNLLSCQKLFN